jgi:hypothetical protein
MASFPPKSRMSAAAIRNTVMLTDIRNRSMSLVS